MRLLNNLEKVVISNGLQRDIINREIPATCTLDIKITLVSGTRKGIEIVPVVKEKKAQT